MKASEVIKEMQEKSKISRILEQKKKDEEEYKKILRELNKPIKPGAIFL